MSFKKTAISLAIIAALSGMTACGSGSSSDNNNDDNSNDNTDTDSLTLTNDNIYKLASGFPGTIVGNGDAADGNVANDEQFTLNIEPGTLIIGAEKEALVITRGSKVYARGTKEDPIVMTSEKQIDAWLAGGDGTSARGEWAGFALMGYARTNECGTPCDVEAEGNIGAYGGDNDADSSGSIEYLVIRHAGNDIDGQGNELNGFTLFGVGSGTKLGYIQVHKGLDDGIEHFGSSDFMHHIVLTDNRDDSFDWGQGYTGGAQFLVVKQAADDADRAIEADNDKGNPNATPVSMPILANMTLIGLPNGDQSADGILLRRGTGAKIYNSIVTGFADACIDIDETATMDRAYMNGAYTGELMIANSFVDCQTDFESGDQDLNGDTAKDTFADVGRKMVADWFAESGSNNNATATADLNSYGLPQGAFASSVQGLPFTAPDSRFINTNYAGAFDPAAASPNWTEGWTVSLNGNTTVWQPASGGTLAGGTPVADKTCPAGTTWVGEKTLKDGNKMDVCQLKRRY